MSTYKTGTVSVTNGSATVVGTGTAWAVALVAGGIFSCAGIAVPIASVTDDTHIVLDYNWPGTTASGATYSIALEYSDAASVVDLNTTLSRLLVTLSLAGITPDASGSLTDRAAISLGVGDKGFLFLHAEIGVAFAFYRWTGTAWDGPFAVQGPPGVGSGGYGLPTGGATGQFLRKSSGTDGATAFATPAASEVGNDSGVTGTKVKDALDTLNSSIAAAAAGLAKRGTVRAATTGNVTISTALNNGDAIDGVTLATGDLVLVKSQTAPAQNGVYVVGVTPVRSTEFDTYDEHPGALIVVQEGTTLADSFWYCTSNVGGTLGTTAINFQQMSLTLADDSITNAKLANMANATIKGRTTAGTGDPEDLTMAQLKALLLSGVVIREVLTANRTYYVLSTGSDSNSGLVNNSGGAFLTIAKALAVVASIDLGGFVATIQVGPATITAGVTLPVLVGGTAILQGDIATPANVAISVTSGVCISAPGVSGWTVQGFKLSTTSLWGVFASNGSTLTLGAMEYGACALGHIYAGGNAVVSETANSKITGGGAMHWQVYDGGRIVVQALTITITGTPAFSTAFAVAGRSASMAINANTFSGSATGVRYAISGNAVIDTAGGGASYIPGGTAGTATTGGQYL